MKKSIIHLLSKAHVLTLMLAALTCTATVSCGDDDDEGGGTIEAAKYASEAVKFNISDANSDYSSIELTEGGSYIIIKNTNASSAKTRATTKSKFANMFISKTKAMTRGSESGILYGTYTKIGDGEYYLEGFGTLKIVSENGTAASLEVTPTGGTTQTIQGNRVSTSSDSQITLNLCRTWKFDKYTVYFKYNGKTMFNISGSTIEELIANEKAWAKANDPDYDESDYDDSIWDEGYEPEKVVFTKSGTYMVYYTDSSIAVVGWEWLSESDGKLRYDWGYDFTDDDSGVAWVKFSGSNLILTEKHVEEEDGDTEEIGTIYTLSEVK